MMEEQIARFPSQFAWEPEGARAVVPEGHPIVLCGMGGSHLGARLLSLSPSCPPLVIHSDYGFPKLPRAWEDTAYFVASSYSGETEEVLDAVREILARGAPLAVITAGGSLLTLAKEHNLPHIVLPKEKLEPRIAMGYQMMALARLLGNETLEKEIRSAGTSLSLSDARAQGEELAGYITGKMPVFCASEHNLPIAYHLKASINETGKMPAAYSTFPELCHNELSSYGGNLLTAFPVLLEDTADDARTKARMDLTASMLEELKVPFARLTLLGDTALSKGLYMVPVGNYAGALLARERGVPDAATPLIAEFKKRLAAYDAAR